MAFLRKGKLLASKKPSPPRGEIVQNTKLLNMRDFFLQEMTDEQHKRN